MIVQDLFEAPQLCPECGGVSFSDLILAEKKDACYYKVKASAKVWPSAYASGRLVQCRKKGADNYGKSKNEDVSEDNELTEEFDLIESIIDRLAEHNGVDAELIWEDLESLTDDELYVFAVTTPLMEDWQKANKKDRTDGMSRKAVKAYRRENPGSKLKTAVTTKPSKLKRGSKASKRRKSYCSRSRGQMKMHSISCAKTPDKAICKARRRWNCESIDFNLSEMDKSQTPPGRDGDIDWTKKQIHLGPEHVIKAKDVAKHALKILNKTMKKSHADTPKKKGAAEGSEYKSRHAHKQEQDKAYNDYRTKHATSSLALMTRAEFAKDQRERAAKKKQGVAEDQLDEINWKKAAATGALALGALGGLGASGSAQARVTPGADGQMSPSAAHQMAQQGFQASAEKPGGQMPNQNLDSAEKVERGDNGIIVHYGGKEYKGVLVPKDGPTPRGAKMIRIAQAQMGERGIGNYTTYLLPNGTAHIYKLASQNANEGVAEGDDNFGKPAAMMQPSAAAAKTAQDILQKQADQNVIGMAKFAGAVPAQGVAEVNNEKIGGRYDPEEFDSMVQRLKKLAGAGPMKTVYDPQKRVYRNMPVAQQPDKK